MSPSKFPFSAMRVVPRGFMADLQIEPYRHGDDIYSLSFDDQEYIE